VKAVWQKSSISKNDNETNIQYNYCAVNEKKEIKHNLSDITENILKGF